MLTKEQAMTEREFIQISSDDINFNKVWGKEALMNKPIHWRANGKCKTWKTRPDEFRLPIKHGLWDYGYITQDNAHLFEVASK